MRSAAGLIWLVTVVFATVPSLAADETLKLVLRTDKTVFAPYEPVVVTYDITNVSTAARTVPALVAFENGWIQFEVGTEGGAFYPFSTGIQGVAGMSYATLEPGARLSGQVIIVTNAVGRISRVNPAAYGDVPVFPLALPGRYLIRASFPLEPQSVGERKPALHSNVLELRVKASRSAEDDLKRFASLDDYAASVGADADAVDLAQAIPRWERFVETSPRSVYTPYVQFELGRTYMDGTGLPSEDFVRAAAHFWAVAKWGSRAIADDAFVHLAEADIELGKYDEARETAVRILKDFPSGNCLERAARLRDGLARGLQSTREIYAH